MLETEIDELIFCGLGILIWFHSSETVAEEEDAVDEMTVCWALDFKVSKENVGAE